MIPPGRDLFGIRKAERELGWKPKIGVEQGEGRLFEWGWGTRTCFSATVVQ